MVQGSLKKASVPTNRISKNPSAPKKGAKAIAPRKQALVKQKQLQKKLSASINRNIEKQMAVKAGAVGKLTIMKTVAESAGGKDAKKGSEHGKKGKK